MRHTWAISMPWYTLYSEYFNNVSMSELYHNFHTCVLLQFYLTAAFIVITRLSSVRYYYITNNAENPITHQCNSFRTIYSYLDNKKSHQSYRQQIYIWFTNIKIRGGQPMAENVYHKFEFQKYVLRYAYKMLRTSDYIYVLLSIPLRVPPFLWETYYFFLRHITCLQVTTECSA